MNDLAEKALHGLDVARRQIAARPMSTFAVLGLAISSAVVVAGGRVNAARATRPLTTWLRLQETHGAQPGDWAAGAAMLGAVVALVVLWVVVVRHVRRHDQPEARVWWVAGAWALPFAIGPALMGTSVQSYAAFGLLQRSGFSPYDFGPNRLTGARIVAAIEPAARGTPSAAGPLGTLLQHLAVSISSGSALGAVLVLRGVALISAVFIGRLAADVAGTGPARSRALTLTVLNPLLLLYVVSGARLEGVMLAFVLAAIAAANQRRWLASIALTCIAGSVLGEAFLLLPVILTVHLLGRRTVAVWLLFGRDLLVAAVTTAVAGLIVRDGFGWLRTIDNQFSAHTPFSITTAIAKLLTPIVRGASYDDLAAGARITAITALVCVLSYLIATARQRALERTAGYALLALALLAPVLYPWYLLWGTTCLAPTANGSRRVAVLALCAAGCVITPPGFTPTTSNVIGGVALALVAVATFAPMWVRRPTRAGVPVSAGR
jgi:alpha-1,6-mannosyltransferase